MTNTGKKTAKILIDTGAVRINTKEPFTLTSGRKSIVYVDCRKLISYPNERRELMKMLAEKLQNTSLESVAGGETAGIPYAAFLSDVMDLPMQYVRKKPKGFGRMNQIEGDLEPGTKVLLMEDLASEGTSKKLFVDVLREAGAMVEHMAVVFFYDIFPQAHTLFEELGVTLHYLATWHDILAYVEENQIWPEHDITALREFMSGTN